MTIPWDQLGAIAACGALGGLVQAMVTGFQLPFRGNDNTCHLASIGSIFVGAVAALVFWCIYGPASSVSTVDGASIKTGVPLLHFGLSILVGFSGGEVLRREAQKMNLMGEKEAEREAKDRLATILMGQVKALKVGKGSGKQIQK